MDQLSSFHKTFFWCTKSVTFPVEAERERENIFVLDWMMLPTRRSIFPRHAPIFSRARPDWLIGAALVLKLKTTCDSIHGCVKV
jgi:hypothetical protein